MMILLLVGGGIFFVIIAALVAYFVLRGKSSSSPKIVTTADGGVSATAGSLKDEIPAVLATVKGEKAADVIASGYFGSVYPGVKVVTKPAALPANAPSFQLLTDSSGRITGVQSNSVLWNG
jgi:hypothetical protein